MVPAPLCRLFLKDSVPFSAAAVLCDWQNQLSETRDSTVKDNKLATTVVKSRHDVRVTVTSVVFSPIARLVFPEPQSRRCLGSPKENLA